MIGRLFRKTVLKRISSFKKLPRKHLSAIPKIASFPKLFLTTHCALLTKETIQNIDLNLQEASDVGENAVIELMDILKENVLDLCKSYKECLKKEIEIIEEASAIGPLSLKWDELPEYRSLAVELSQELSNFTTAINTIGQMIHDDTMQHITQQAAQLTAIATKYQQLKEILRAQMEEIRKLEGEVLEVKKKSILQAR